MASQPDLDEALLKAAEEGTMDEILSLLDRNANVNTVDDDTWTPLHYASAYGHHQCVELLLDRHANINAVDDDTWTPLHHASAYGHHQCIELLLDRHANINAVDDTTPSCVCLWPSSMHRAPS